MDDWAPEAAPPGASTKGLVLGGAGTDGELDKLQAWKKAMKEKDAPSTAPQPPLAEANSTPSESPAGGLNDIERFKLQMKEAKSKSSETQPPSTSALVNGAPPGLSLPTPNDPAIVTHAAATLPPSDPAIVAGAFSTVGLSTTSAIPPATIATTEAQSISLAALGLGQGNVTNGTVPIASAPPSNTISDSPTASTAANHFPTSDQSHPQSSASLFKTFFNTDAPKADQATVPASQTSTASHSPVEARRDAFSAIWNDPRNGQKPNSPNPVNGTHGSATTPTNVKFAGTDVEVRPSRGLSNAVPQGLAAAANAPGRGSKFAKFFQTPGTPKDEGNSHANTTPAIPASVNMQPPQPSVNRDSLLSNNNPTVGLLGGSPNPMSVAGSPGTFSNGVQGANMNGTMGLGGHVMGGRIASPTQSMLLQQQQQISSANSARINGSAGDVGLAGLLSGLGGIDRAGGGMTGGTMEGIMAALDATVCRIAFHGSSYI